MTDRPTIRDIPPDSPGCAEAVAEARSWADPIPLDMLGELPGVPEPDLSLLPARLAAWAEDIAYRMQCPPAFIPPTVFTGLSSLIGRRLTIRPKRHDPFTVVPNSWGCVVGKSGFMKTPTISAILEPLKAFQAAATQDHQHAAKVHERAVSAAKAAAEVRRAELKKRVKRGEPIASIAQDEGLFDPEPESPAERRFIINDASMAKLGEILQDNPGGSLFLRDELVGLLRSLDMPGEEPARALLLECWNGDGEHRTDRITRGSTMVPCCLSVFGGIQPGPLASYLANAAGDPLREDGLIQRFQCIAWPDMPPDFEDVDEWPAPGVREAAHRVFAAVRDLDPIRVGAQTDGHGRFPFVRFDAAAQELAAAWRTGLEKRVRDPELDERVAAHLSKFRSLGPSLALIDWVAEGAAGGAVPQASLERAIYWAEFFERHAARIYAVGSTEKTDASDLLDRVLKQVRDARAALRRDGAAPDPRTLALDEGVFTRRDATRWTRWPVSRVDAALRLLERHRYLRRDKGESRLQGGARGLVCTLNPRARSE